MARQLSFSAVETNLTASVVNVTRTKSEEQQGLQADVGKGRFGTIRSR